MCLLCRVHGVDHSLVRGGQIHGRPIELLFGCPPLHVAWRPLVYRGDPRDRRLLVLPRVHVGRGEGGHVSRWLLQGLLT
jgi:hypothetical protein